MSGLEPLYALADVAAGKPSTMMLFPLGEWRSEKYPKLSLPQELADAVIANFQSDVLHRRVPVESVGSHDATSPAGGWVDRVYVAPFEWQGLSGDALYADWTPNERGAQIVNDGQYAYNSVELDSFIDPMTGDKSVNVLKAVALTNRPVLSFMPPVKDAGDSIKLAEPVEIALSEIIAADPATPTEDPGSHAEPASGSSEPDSHPAKGDEGQDVALADGDAEQEGAEKHMNPKILHALKLSEGADEAAIEAAVVTLSEERDNAVASATAAERKLAEVEKATHDADVATRLDAAVTLCEITPGERVTLAEADDVKRDAYLEARKGYKAIVLGETGSGKAGDESIYANASVELAEKAKARKAADGITFAAAQALVLTEDTDLAARYGEFRTERK